MAVDISGYSAYWTFTPSSGIGRAPTTYGEPAPTSGQNFAILNNLGKVSQAFTTTVAGTHRIRFSANVRYWNNVNQTIAVKVDGVTAYLSQVGDIARGTGSGWTALDIPWNIPTPGPHTLSLEGQVTTGDETMFVDSVSITGPNSVAVPLLNPGFDGYALDPGSFFFNPPAVATPAYRLIGKTTTSGKLLHCRLVRISDGTTVNMRVINEAPTIKVNGVSRGAVRLADVGFSLISTPVHPTFLFPLPAGVVVAAGDVVTLSGSAGWAFGPNGYAEAMAGQAADVRTGRSFVRDSDAPRTMGIGASHSFYVTTEWRNGLATKNQRYRCTSITPDPVQNDVQSGWKPLVMAAATSYSPFIGINESTNIDATGYPTPEGYWAVRWDDVAPGGTSFGITTQGDSKGTATRVPSLSNPGVGGVGRVEVFDVRKSGVATNVPLWLKIDVAGPSPWNFRADNLAVLAPGDFTWKANTPTGIPMPLWHELPACLTAKMPFTVPFSGIRCGTSGIQLAESAACEREHLVNPSDFRWSNDVKSFSTIGFTQARPWTNAQSPYIYDPLPGAGTPYNATLFQPIATAPAPGTVETIVISDALTAPILAGLVLTIGSERLRVMATPTSPNVSVMRGVESTTPATHTGGVISVSGRRAHASLATFGDQNKQVTEFVTQSPHGLKSGQNVVFTGSWPAFIYTDNRGSYGGTFGGWTHPAFVTGANSFLVVFNANQDPPDAPNTTVKRVYDSADGITPANSYAVNNLPEYGGCPYEYTAAAAAKYPAPGGACWLSLCNVASDDMVDEIWRRILANLPADRVCYFELGDEPWNFAGSPYRYWLAQSFMLYGIGDPNYWNAVRTQQVRARGRAIWAAAGRDPTLIRSTMNVIAFLFRANQMPGLLNFLKARGSTPDVITLGLYPDFYYAAPLLKAYVSWPMDMIVDMYTWDAYDGTAGDYKGFAGHMRQRVGSFRAMLDNWNAANSPPVGLGIYEYAPEQPWPVYSVNLPQDMTATQTSLVLPIGDGDPGTLAKINTTTGEALDSLDDLFCDTTKVQAGSWLLVASEWMHVVSRTNNVCVVDRAQNGTTAAFHGRGASYSSLLVGSITAGAGSVTVDGTAGAFQGQYLKCGAEWMLVSAPPSGQTLQVSRGQLGTAAAAHANRDAISGGTGIRNDYVEGIRDIVLHPGYRVAHRDILELFQELGVIQCMPSALDQTWNFQAGWADYHAITQQPGMGDGSDGKFDNRLCQTRPGQPGTKASTTSLDANTVSVRGQAFIEFLTATATTPTPTSGRRRPVPSGRGFRNRPR